MNFKHWFFLFFIFDLSYSDDDKVISLSKFIYAKHNYDQYIINRPKGLYKIDGFDQNDSTKGIILIHGYYPENWKTKGFEWTKPINVLSKAKLPMWFFRHDWNQCPSNITIDLKAELKNLMIRDSKLESLIIIGHSFGGLIVTLLAEQWNSDFLLEVHSIASGLGKSNFDRTYSECANPKKDKYTISAHVNYKQWKTIKNQDGIFKYLKNDSQIVKIINGESELLPEKWKGIRVGHNYSIVNVSDFILLNLLEQE